MNRVISFVLIAFFCSTIFIGIGVFSLRKKTPVKFWSNQRVEVDEISDVTSYNRAVGLLWLCFGFSLALCSIFHLVLQNMMGPILYALTTMIGIGVMSVKYGKILNKYKK